MKIIETKEVLEFLCLFNYPNNLKISSSPVFDTQFHKGDKVVEQIHHFEALNFQSTYFNRESILRAGLLLEGKLKIEDKLKIVLYLTKKFHHSSLNAIYPSYREILLLAAHALGLHNSEVQEIITFQLTNKAFADREDTIYFINKNAVCSHEQVCVNTIPYNKEATTYVKYLRSSNILIAKKLSLKNRSNFLFDSAFSEEIQVVTKKTFNREDFALLTFDEVVEKIENFNPITYYEIQATNNTPKIILDPELGKVIISGDSSPLAQTHFFAPILEWVTSFKNAYSKTLDIYIMLETYNSYTAKSLVKLTKESKMLTKSGCSTKIYWYCDMDDKDMREFGTCLHKINSKNFEFCFINEEIAA